MNITTINANILDIESDALIYSTNTKLLLSGGVGASLLKAYGPSIQTQLMNKSTGFGMELADIGEVLSCKTDNMPWKKVIHTICSDGSYIINPKTIEQVLIKAFNLCIRDRTIKKITISALGTGYGTIEQDQFINILYEVTKNNNFKPIEDIIVCLVEGNRH